MVLQWTEDALRDEFAGKAIASCFVLQMQNIQANAEAVRDLPPDEFTAAMCEGIADLAYQVADAMMERRKQKPTAEG